MNKRRPFIYFFACSKSFFFVNTTKKLKKKLYSKTVFIHSFEKAFARGNIGNV